MEHGDRDDPSNQSSSSTTDSYGQSQSSSASSSAVSSSEESGEEVTSLSQTIIGAICQEKRPRDGSSGGSVDPSSGSGGSKRSKKARGGSYAEKHPTRVLCTLAGNKAVAEHEDLPSLAKVEDVGFIEYVINTLNTGAVDRVKHRTSTIEENKKELFHHTVWFLYDLYKWPCSEKALKDEVMKQQGFVEVLTHEKSKLKCDIHNLQQQLEMANSKCRHLEADLAAKGEELDEKDKQVTTLEAVIDDLRKESHVMQAAIQEREEALKRALDAAEERKTEIAVKAVEDYKASSDFAAILAAERAAEEARYLQMMRSQWLKVNKMSKDLAAYAKAQVQASNAAMTSESSSTHTKKTPPQEPPSSPME